MSAIIDYLIENQAQEEHIDAMRLRERINQLRDWQCRRLLHTYESLHQQKRFAPAIEFFTTELYGPNDFSQRDADLKKAAPLMEAALSDKTIGTFILAVKLNTLSFKLDIALVQQIGNVDHITSEQYAEAYQACENKDERQRQLEYIELLARELDRIANRASILMILKLARIPAQLAGLGELQRILEEGASAFRKIGKINDFIDPILNGETAIMQKIFAGEPCLPEI